MISPAQTVILIPTYNEAKNIRLTIERVYAVNENFNVLVLDDDSLDGTGQVVKELMATHPRLSLMERKQNKGFAQSYIDGFKKVIKENKHQVVITMDADFSHEPEELPFLLKLLDNGADVVMGSRYTKPQDFPHISKWRRILSRFANNYVRFMLNLPVTDCTSGFIAMKLPVLHKFHFDTMRTEGYGFLFELKYRAYRAGFKFAEHPVKWPERHQGASKMNMKRIFESARLPWKIRFSTTKHTT